MSEQVETERLERGASVGPYLVLERVDDAALGRWYVAYDPRLERKVAIRLLPVDADGRAALVADAEALSRVTHPNLVAVLEAGVRESCVYVVTELVDGVPMRAWLSEKSRTWHEVLEAFVMAGRALAEAHRAQRAHGGFGPDRLKVDRDGQVRVSDFALAGWLAPLRAGASPEARAGGPVDPRSDQFSFCYALCEALYGQPPAAIDDTGKFRPPPKRAGVPARVRRALRRGLSPAPQARFPSMDVLLDTLGGGRSARLRKRVALGAAALVVTGGVVSALVSWVGLSTAACRGGQQRLEGAWDPARRAQVKSALLASGRPYAADAFKGLSQVLDAHAEAFSKTYAEACQAARGRGERTEEELQLTWRCLDQRLLELKALVELVAQEGEAAAEHAMPAALSLSPMKDCEDTRALAMRVAPPGDDAAEVGMAQVATQLANARALEQLGQWEKALVRARLAAESARSVGHPPLLAEALVLLGSLQGRTSDAVTAERTLHEAIRVAELGKDDERRAEAWIELVAVVGVHQGRHEEGHRIASQAEAVVRRLGPDHEPQKVALASSVGTLLWLQGRLEEAQARAEEALSVAEQVLPPGHRAVRGAIELLARVQSDRGRLQDALRLHQRSLSAAERTLGAEHPQAAAALEAAAGVLLELGRVGDARKHLERGVSILERSGPGAAGRFCRALSLLSRAQARQGDADNAVRSAQKALALGEHAAARDEVPALWLALGEALEAKADHAGASERRARALALTEATHGKSHPRVAVVLLAAGEGALERGDGAGALAYARRAADIREKVLGPDHPAAAEALSLVGRALLATDQAAQAVGVLEQAAVVQGAREGDPGVRAWTTFALARALWSAGREKDRAVELAIRSRAELATAEARGPKGLAEVDEWLKQRGR